MRRSLCGLAAGLAACAVFAAVGFRVEVGSRADAAAPAIQNEPVRVLLVLGSPPFHDIVSLPPILEELLERMGGFEVARLEPPDPENNPADGAHIAQLANLQPGDYDVLVFYTTGLELSPDAEQALQTFVEQGGGIVALHGASASFGNSDVWTRLVGGRFSGHIPGLHELPVVISDEQHPVTAGIEPFAIVDEEYQHTFVEDAERHVLARFRDRPAESTATNNDIIWTREVGEGRVFYNALGHGREAWENPAWQLITVRAILWCAGRGAEVRLPE